MTRTLMYYPAGGAMRIDSEVYYVLRDHLGSAMATTDASGPLRPSGTSPKSARKNSLVR